MSDTVQARAPGRPPHLGVKSWHRSSPLERRVRSVLAPREKGDELAVTTNSEVVTRVLRIGRRYLGRSLTAREGVQLRRHARSAKPSEITRLLYRWRDDLTEREVRGLQPLTHVVDVMWA